MIKTRTQHYVTFFYPAALGALSVTKPIASWDPALAGKMARSSPPDPFGYEFSTSLEADPASDDQGGTMEVRPRVARRSGVYYLNGKVETLEDIERRATSAESILLENMRDGEWDRVVTTRTGRTEIFHPCDCVVDFDGNILVPAQAT